MTVESTITKRIYQANGATTEWPVPFAYSRADDICLMLTGADGVETRVASNFRVNVNEAGDTSVTCPVSGEPLPLGVKLTIYRATPMTQIVDLAIGGPFNPQVLEKDGFDRLEYQIQEMQEYVDRKIGVPISSAETPEELAAELFAARDRAQASAELSGAAAADAHLAAARAQAGAQDAGDYAAAASDAENMAAKWAENPKGVPVVAGRHSALHWAEKARDNAAEGEAVLEEIKASQGTATYLTAHGFGDPALDPGWQQTLTDYALAQVPEWTSPANSTFIVNLWDGHEWVYNTETGVWVEYGTGAVQQATNDTAGTVKGDAATPWKNRVLSDASTAVNTVSATANSAGLVIFPTATELETGLPDAGRESLPIAMPLGKAGGGADGQPLLSLLWSTTPLAEDGYLDISKDNGLLSRAAFPDAWAKIQRMVDAGATNVLTDAAWQAEKTANGGVCGKYSKGDGVSTFRVPLIAKRFVRATGSDLPVGTAQGDAIRNITGNAGAATTAGYQWEYTTGAFVQGAATSSRPSFGGSGGNILSFNASNAVPTAEENRPVSIAYIPLLKMYGAVTDAGAANIAALIQATAGKLDTSQYETDTANGIAPMPKTATGIGQVGTIAGTGQQRLPSGGTYYYTFRAYNPTTTSYISGAGNGLAGCGVAAGGTLIGATYGSYTAVSLDYWRIA